MDTFKRKHPLPPALPPPLCNEVAVRSMLFAIHACVNGPSSSLAVPSKKKGTSARAPLDSNRMGAHTAMCAGGVLAQLSILLLFFLLTSATEGVEMFMRLGSCVSFWLPIGLADSLVFVDIDGIVEHVSIGSLRRPSLSGTPTVAFLLSTHP